MQATLRFWEYIRRSLLIQTSPFFDGFLKTGFQSFRRDRCISTTSAALLRSSKIRNENSPKTLCRRRC